LHALHVILGSPALNTQGTQGKANEYLNTVLTMQKDWKHWQVQEHDDTGVAETKVVQLLCPIKAHVIIQSSDNKY
jgi:hypothetical protein